MGNATQTAVESWTPVVGLEGSYEVSNLGRIKSLPRKVRKGDKWVSVRGRILKTPIGSAGYPKVTIGGKNMHVHSVVAPAWLGPRPEGLVVCHNNGDPTDNRASNLRYDTRSANNLDKTRHGNDFRANKTHCLRGHEYTPENTGHHKTAVGAGRFCRECKRILRLQRVAARRGALTAPEGG